MIKVVIAFINIGPYHFARLISASKFAKLKGFDLKILQVTNNKLEHPWGEIKNDLVSDIHTLALTNEKSEKNVLPNKSLKYLKNKLILILI